MELSKYNRHWDKRYKYPYDKKRNKFRLIAENTYNRQIVEIIGLRRTGKTTILFQIINKLVEEGVSPFNIWYFTFDEEQVKLDDLIIEFRKQTKMEIYNNKIYILLDEIQKLPDFQNQLKVYYDLYPEIKFFISGSTSLFITKKTQESLAGRLKSVFLPVLSFSEYLSFTNKTEILSNPAIWEKEIEIEYENYWGSQFIETIFMNKNDTQDYLTSILNKIIFEDIPKIFSVENPEILLKIVKVISQNPGMIINYENIANDLKLTRKTISKYYYILEESFIIYQVYNYSNNQLTSEKKLKKAYLGSASFTNLFSGNTDKGKIVENVYLSAVFPKFFWRDVYKHEVNFIHVTDDGVIPVEIKYKSEIKPSEMQNLFLFCRRYSIDNAIVLMKRIDDKKIDYKGLTVTLKSLFL